MRLLKTNQATGLIMEVHDHTKMFDEQDKYLVDNQLQCMRCGFCLPTCPTYALTGRERSSPRGRVALARAVAEGNMALTQAIQMEAFFCLDCRACTTSCPSGVRPGEIMELYRNKANKVSQPGKSFSGLRRFVLQKMLPNPELMERSMLAARLYQKFAVKWLIRNTKAIKMFPEWVERADGMLPELSFPLRPHLPDRIEAQGKKRGRVGFFLGCVMSLLFPEVSRQTVRVLAAQGFDVVIPKEIKCCGAPHINEGDRETITKLALHNVKVFEDAGVDYIVTDCAACGALLKEYNEILGNETHPALNTFVKKVRDVSEFLVEKGFKTEGLHEVPRNITYHEPCHLCHAQGVSSQPRHIFKQIPGVKFQELNESSWCCGSAATWGLKFTEESNQILQRKLDNIAKTGADTVVTANPGCYLQLSWGLKKTGMKQKVIHIVELIGEALE